VHSCAHIAPFSLLPRRGHIAPFSLLPAGVTKTTGFNIKLVNTGGQGWLHVCPGAKA
jgi:hypothetical protein